MEERTEAEAWSDAVHGAFWLPSVLLLIPIGGMVILTALISFFYWDANMFLSAFKEIATLQHLRAGLIYAAILSLLGFWAGYKEPGDGGSGF